MGVAIGVTRLDYSSAELRSLARHEAGAVACRTLAIAHVLDGASRAEAAASCGMARQTLRDWVHWFNAEGCENALNVNPT
jgi:transposase